MALTVKEIQPGDWTLLSDSSNNISFQNASGSSYLLIQVANSAPANTVTDGFLYTYGQKEMNVAITSLSIGGGTKLYGRPAGGMVCRVVVEE